MPLTLAASDTESQLPPDRAYCPLPMRARISSGVSSGPFAKGVNLCDDRDGVHGATPLPSSRVYTVRLLLAEPCPPCPARWGAAGTPRLIFLGVPVAAGMGSQGDGTVQSKSEGPTAGSRYLSHSSGFEPQLQNG